jgi:antitoxin component YwqK of YwqJK toxin-antitoxin module
MQTVHYTHGKKNGHCKTISTGGRMKFEGTYNDGVAVDGTFFEYNKESGGDIVAYSNGNLTSRTPLKKRVSQ